jgi:hypothetical protein
MVSVAASRKASRAFNAKSEDRISSGSDGRPRQIGRDVDDDLDLRPDVRATVGHAVT